VIGSANGRIGITGLGVCVPDRVFTNKDLEQFVDTTDEWILERTGIRERRFATDEQALTDIAGPAAVAAMADAGVEPSSIDLIVVATVTPDMMFPTSSALLADSLGMPDAAAYDLLAGCTGFMYAVAQAYSMVASGLSTAQAQWWWSLSKRAASSASSSAPTAAAARTSGSRAAARAASTIPTGS
jgi:3-oxoacyl-(acyl-carrier-protein) synthase III